MADFAGVDPHRVRLLANALKDLAEALNKNGATIRSNFSEWGGSLNLGQLASQSAQVGDDARDMSLRADEAQNLLSQSQGVVLCTPSGDWVSIPWNVKDIDTTKEAQQEAATLKKALDNPKDPKSRNTITEIAQSLSDHQGDSAYMTAFLLSGGLTDAAKVATALHDEDGTHDGVVLSKDSERILGQFGQATQIMSGLAVKGNYPHPAPDYLAALTSPPGGDMWSVGMLFKYGPGGDQWDPKVLSDVGGAMLDWRARQKAMRPSYSSPDFPYSAGGYVGKDDGGWYHSLGLDPDYLTHGADENDRIAAGIRANDPALAVISRLGENAQASRDLLGNDDDASKRFAKELVDFKWQTPGETTQDDSDAVRRVLTLAATDRSAANRDQSGLAAANILAAAAQQKDVFDGRNGFEKDEYKTYPKGTAIALAGITATWADDLGGTSASATGGLPSYDSNDHDLVSKDSDVVKVMQLFAKDDTDAAVMFDTTLHQQVSDALSNSSPSEQLTRLGNAAGLFTKAKVGISYTQAQQVDEDHKFNLALLNTAGSLFGYIPGPKAANGETLTGMAKVVEKGLKYSQNLVTMGRSIVAPNTDPFSTNNAAKQEALNQAQARDQFKTFAPSIAQGLIRSGKIPPPADRSWYDPTTGTVSVDPRNHSDFDGWWNTVNEKQQYIASFQGGFDNSEGSVDGK